MFFPEKVQHNRYQTFSLFPLFDPVEIDGDITNDNGYPQIRVQTNQEMQNTMSRQEMTL